VYLTNLPQSKAAYEGEPCAIEAFDSEKSKWFAKFLHPRFQGAAILVDEENLSFGYCTMALKSGVDLGKVAAVDEQLCLGRGLVAQAACSKGEVLLQENPFMITAGDVFELIRVYFMLIEESGSNPTKKKILDAFYSLALGNMPESSKKRVWQSAKEAFESASGGSADGSESQVATVMDQLLRWETNRFSVKLLPNAETYALYKTVSILNHSCTPSVQSVCELKPFNPGVLVADDVCCVVRARQDLTPGDALTVNYGPEDLLSWPVERRRKHLLENNGFTCQCQRCLDEAGAVA